MNLRDRVVWLTGASSGIGEALTYQLVQAGARVVISARRREQLERVRAASADPERVHVLPLDMTDLDGFEAAHAEAKSAFGPIDLLWHNAGVTQRSLAHETEMATVRRIMELNFFGPVALTRLVVPEMIERGSGQIAVVSSLAGHVGTPRRSTYSASKHALHGYFDSMRAELHDRGIRITMLCPGFIATPLTQSALTADGSAFQGDGNKDKAMSPEACARSMIRAVHKDANEAFMGGKEVMVRWVKRVSPNLLASFVRRVKSS